MLTNSDNVPVTVGIVSTSTLGDLNSLKLVTKSSDVTQFGTGNLTDALNILLKYNIHAVAVRVATGVDAPATAANIVGATDDEGLRLLKTVKSTLGRDVVAVIVPKVQNDSVVTQMVDTATELKSLAVAEWLGTYADLITARGTATNYGLKSKNLAIVFGQPFNQPVAESASAHLAAMIGQQQKYYNFGLAPIKRKLRDISSVTPALTSLQKSDLMLQGVVIIDTMLVDQFVFNGTRNSLYPSDTLSQDAFLMRMLVEQIISTGVQSYLDSKLGLKMSNTYAYTLEAELSAFLSQYVEMKAVSKAYAKYNQAGSDFDAGTLLYDVCVTLISYTGIASFTFQVVA